MSDEDIRELERRAATGDTEAQSKVATSRCRIGMCCAHALPEKPFPAHVVVDDVTLHGTHNLSGPGENLVMELRLRVYIEPSQQLDILRELVKRLNAAMPYGISVYPR